MNCRRRGAASAGLKPDNPNKPGNGVANYGDKELMEFKRIDRRPYWEDPPVVIPSEDK